MKKLRSRQWAAIALALGVGLAALVAWRLHVAHRPGPAEVRADVPQQDGKLLRFSDAYADRVQLRTVAAEQAMLTPSLHLLGRVAYDPRRVAALGARVSGRVRALHHVVGDEVKKGDLLVEIESAELGRAQADALKARAREQAALADAHRERQLADAHVSAERDAQAAEATSTALRAERVVTEKAVEALGGELNGALGVVYLRSPLQGRITELLVSQGQSVQDSFTAVRVADLTHLWAELTIYERDLGSVRLGDTAEVLPQFAPAHAHEAQKGTVSYIGDEIDPTSHSTRLRVELDNPGGLLRPGLDVVATVQASGPAAEYISVPPGAVTRIDGKPLVFVSVEKLAVEPRAVELGPESLKRVAILKGLDAGEQVVVSGVFALKSEAFR